MASDLQFRRAGPRDRDAVLGLHRALYVTHRETVLDAARADFYAYRDLDAALVEDVESLLATDDGAVLLAERDGRVVGYITGRLVEDTRRVLPRRGIVEDWLVLPEERGRGTGRALMDLIAGVFREAGCTMIESATWPFNDGARRAHEALGFLEYEIRYRRKL